MRGVSFAARDGQITGLLGAERRGQVDHAAHVVHGAQAGRGRRVDRRHQRDRGSARGAARRSACCRTAPASTTISPRARTSPTSASCTACRAPIARRAPPSSSSCSRCSRSPTGYAKGFSQGQKLKTALARALVHRPRNVLLDEPTNGLDVMAVRGLRKLLVQLRDAGHCVLFSSHVMQEVEQLCDEVVVIAGGQVVAAGALADIRARAGNSQLEDAFVHLMGTGDEAASEPARHLGGVPQGIPREPARPAHACCRRWCSVRCSGRSSWRRSCSSASRMPKTQSDENIKVAVIARRARAQPARLSCARAASTSRRWMLDEAGCAPGGRHADPQDHPGYSGGFRRAPAGG